MAISAITNGIKEAAQGLGKVVETVTKPVTEAVGALSSAVLGAKEGNADLQDGWEGLARTEAENREQQVADLGFDPNEVEVGAPANQFLAQNSAGPGRLRIAVIDDFTAEGNGNSEFNHGQTIRNIIEQGGAVTSGAVSEQTPPIETVNYNIDTGNGDRTEMIAHSLNDVYTRLHLGEDFDAINISQQDFEESNYSRAVETLIGSIQRDFGVPVVVAAGNQGADQRNVLADGALFRVENSTPGSEQRADSSGVGNLRSEGAFTSQATANVTTRAAQLSDLGYSLPQIEFIIQREAFNEGGSLDAAPEPTAFTPGGQLPNNVFTPNP